MEKSHVIIFCDNEGQSNIPQRPIYTWNIIETSTNIASKTGWGSILLLSPHFLGHCAAVQYPVLLCAVEFCSYSRLDEKSPSYILW